MLAEIGAPNSSQHMRQLIAIVGMLGLAAAANAETLRGELSFNSRGFVWVSECRSGRVLRLGEMQSNQYQRLIDQYWRLSFNGKTPVVVEIRGDVTSSGPPGTELILESPNVVTLVGGSCRDRE